MTVLQANHYIRGNITRSKTNALITPFPHPLTSFLTKMSFVTVESKTLDSFCSKLPMLIISLIRGQCRTSTIFEFCCRFKCKTNNSSSSQSSHFISNTVTEKIRSWFWEKGVLESYCGELKVL